MLILFGLVAAGCAPATYAPPAECEGQASLILEEVKDPKALGKALLLVNLSALEALDGYEAEDAIAVLDQIEQNLNSPAITYGELVGYILMKVEVANSLAGATIFILGDDLTVLDKPFPVSSCDDALIRRHLAKQRAMVTLYAAGKK